MINSTTLSADERARYEEFDRERGLRLSRIVGFAFAGVCTLAFLAMVTYTLADPNVLQPAFVSMGVALVACIVLYLLAISLTRRWSALPAAALVAASTVLAIAMFQIARESAVGVDSLVVAAFAAYTLPIGLAGVVGSPRLMFVIAAVITAICVVVGLAMPARLQLDRLQPTLVVMVCIASSVHWLVAVLVYGASTLYIQTMHELRSIRRTGACAQLDALKDQFITHVNHELRTPIMTMRGISSCCGSSTRP